MSISTVQTTINGQTHTLTYNASTGKYEATLTAPAASSFPLSGGYYPVSVTATDTAGNSTTVDNTDATLGNNLRLYVKEQVKPTIQLVSPQSGDFVTTATPTITFRLRDNSTQSSGFSGINQNSLVVKINGTAVTGTTFTAATGGFDCSLSLASHPLSDGTQTITIDVSDNDGNAATTLSSTFTVDTVAPSLVVSSPVDGFETNQSTVTVSGTTDDATSKPVTVNILLNGTDVGTVTVSSSGAFSKTITLTQQGNNSIVINAIDAAGKQTSVTRTVVYNTNPPVITSVTITPNPTFAGTQYVIAVEVT